MYELRGRVAIVTGAGRQGGLGRAIAERLAAEGCDVVISDLGRPSGEQFGAEHIGTTDEMETIAEELRGHGVRALAVVCDVRSERDVEAMVERATGEFGRLDILVNNAAYHLETSEFLEITPEQLERTFRTNIMSFFWTTQAALPHLQAGDSIINVGSVVAMMGYPELIDYACTKAAIHNFTKSLAQMLAPKGIRVNTVAPGPVWTPLIPSTRDEEFVGEFGANTLWERPAQPIEIATSFVFLASADARYFTGEVLAPTGFRFTSR